MFACTLMIVLWSRSYNDKRVHENTVEWQTTHDQTFAVACERGKLYFGLYDTYRYPMGSWQLFHASDGSWWDHGSFARFYFGNTWDSSKLILPFWFLVVLSGVVAAIAGVRRPIKFSLRAMLIVTTAVAMTIGLATYAANK